MKKGEMAVRQRSGGMIFLAASIACGLLAALLTVSFLQSQAKMTTVLVAVDDIAPFTPLEISHFATRQWPSQAVPHDAITDAIELQGRYARTLILSGTPIRAGHLAGSAGGGSDLAARLTEVNDPAMRAIAVAVDRAQGVGGTVQPGDKVDVIAAVRVERENGPSVTFSKVIARAVPVLYKAEGEQGGKQHVVLMVTPQQAEEIAYAQMAGTVVLATNPYRTEPQPTQTPGVTPDLFIRRHGR
jgi:pilus assembly protein CpaB